MNQQKGYSKQQNRNKLLLIDEDFLAGEGYTLQEIAVYIQKTPMDKQQRDSIAKELLDIADDIEKCTARSSYVANA